MIGRQKGDRNLRPGPGILVAAVLALSSTMSRLSALEGQEVQNTEQAEATVGLGNPNLAKAEELRALPHMTEELVKSLIEARPFLGAPLFDAFLTENGLSKEQRTEIYARSFVPINLNTATSDEIQLIPGAGRKMAREFDEYRPWKNFKQFHREIGKYVDDKEVARLQQYCFIPILLNTATDEEILSIPGVGKKMLHEFKEYRPWKTKAQFDKEISKYVGDRETARLWRYVVIDSE